ncbi:hypothetical protein SARC_02219 [Sphaeroforma arctica JP610]|uniref:Histone deacetylase interacting domain-containing protein n=1 Tax=Sphaeroforma arctica JP610 TaxID=667725 RepID=A0A0L0GBI8_9EUKA|nr:hypothetical protein SARC_02219 [Sphaeroforma arctica JP610]KNC85598.1 hypothetical protein SARC_02219 [Sphaeroforma arctica JP610]|eukprot:XP_014159500.1 hypothetical protein SARC_02219 [Sphaeroforma arctica JP610]
MHEYNTNGGRDFFSPPKPKPVVTFGQLQPKALGIEAATEGTQKPKVNPKSRPLKRKTPNSLFGASNSSETFAGIEAVEANKVPSEAELQGSKPYMTEVKRIKKDQYKNFMLLLLNAKRGKVSAHQLLDQVNQMFGDTPHLLRAFRQFLPPKDLPLWDQRMSTAL